MLISFENTVNNEFKIWITIFTILNYVDKFQIMLKKEGGDKWINFISFALTSQLICISPFDTIINALQAEKH